MLLVCVVELGYSNLIFMLEILLAELVCQVFLGSNMTWCECGVSSISTISEAL